MTDIHRRRFPLLTAGMLLLLVVAVSFFAAYDSPPIFPNKLYHGKIISKQPRYSTRTPSDSIVVSCTGLLVILDSTGLEYDTVAYSAHAVPVTDTVEVIATEETPHWRVVGP